MTNACATIDPVVNAVGSKKVETAAEELARDVKTGGKVPTYLGARVKEEMTAMMNADDFTGADALHFLALHNLLHEKIYGVEDPDLAGQSLRVWRRNVQKMLSVIGPQAMLEFVRWAWNQERSREAWRRENFFEAGRLSAFKLFSRHKLTEYRLALARQKAR